MFDETVVVQGMVCAGSAGLIFSYDPVRGQPDCMIITANFNIKLSIVSPIADPDSFIQLRAFTPEGLTNI